MRWLLLPLALLYGIGVTVHRFLYASGIIQPIQFSLPILSVGNLSVGGSGKTPQVEYLVRFLRRYLIVGVLSRGYSRKSTGFFWVSPYSSVEEVGDEPLQIKRRFPEIPVAVCENRVGGVSEMVADQPDLQVLLLDDAFQHRAILPLLDIVLTPYHAPFFRDYLLPVGRLREGRSASKRADILIVSQCPDPFTPAMRDDFLEQLQPLPQQRVYFSTYAYGRPYHILNPDVLLPEGPWPAVLLVTGIARVEHLEAFLRPQVVELAHRIYEDHHYYSLYELGIIQRQWENLNGGKGIVLTTEKDASRLLLHGKTLADLSMPVYVLPVETCFLDEDGEAFQAQLRQSLLDFRS